MSGAATLPEGFRALPGHLDAGAQRTLLAEVRAVLAEAPLYRPVMPRSGRPLSARMSNAGPQGWTTDIAGYRYRPDHPETGRPWPAIPPLLLDLWARLAPWPDPPQCCLINHYQGTARLGLHRDEDEAAAEAPILNVSLGDDALFRLGGPARRDPTRSFRVASGTVMIFAGPARHAFHGVDRILPGTSGLLAEGGRISLTLRRVTR